MPPPTRHIFVSRTNAEVSATRLVLGNSDNDPEQFVSCIGMLPILLTSIGAKLAIVAEAMLM